MKKNNIIEMHSVKLGHSEWATFSRQSNEVLPIPTRSARQAVIVVEFGSAALQINNANTTSIQYLK